MITGARRWTAPNDWTFSQRGLRTVLSSVWSRRKSGCVSEEHIAPIFWAITPCSPLTVNRHSACLGRQFTSSLCPGQEPTSTVLTLIRREGLCFQPLFQCTDAFRTERFIRSGVMNAKSPSCPYSICSLGQTVFREVRRKQNGIRKVRCSDQGRSSNYPDRSRMLFPNFPLLMRE